MLTITTADAITGGTPTDAAGALFRRAERLLCRDHLTADHLHDVHELGVIVYGFHRCDACAADELADAIEAIDSERNTLIYGDPSVPPNEADMARLDELELARRRLATIGL